MDTTMEGTPNVEIEIATKLVEATYFEFSTAYSPAANSGDEASRATPHVQVLRGTSSVIAPGLSVQAV